MNHTKENCEQDLFKANKIIQKRTRYNCGLIMDAYEKGLISNQTRYFFESPDGQNGELYSELRKLGYSDAGYNAEYYWKVSKDDYIISYTEGDIDIYPRIK